MTSSILLTCTTRLREFVGCSFLLYYSSHSVWLRYQGVFVWGFLNCCDITIFCWAHNNHKKTIFGKMFCILYNSTILLLSWTVEFEKNVKSWCIKVFLLNLIFYIYFITSFCNTWHDCVQNFEYNTMCKAEFERASPIIMTQIGRNEGIYFLSTSSR